MIDFSSIMKNNLPIYKNDPGDVGANLGRVTIYFILMKEYEKAKEILLKGIETLKSYNWERDPKYKDLPGWRLSSDQLELPLLADEILKTNIDFPMKLGGLLFPNHDIRRLHQFKWGKPFAWLFHHYLEWHLKWKPNDTSDSVNFYCICRARKWKYGNIAAVRRYFQDNDKLCVLMRQAIDEMENL